MSGVVREVASFSGEWSTLDLDYGSVSEFPKFQLANSSSQICVQPVDTWSSDREKTSSDLFEVGDEVRQAFYISLDRVFLNTLNMTERESLLFRYVVGMMRLIDRHIGEPGQAYFTSTPHFHWDIALSACLQHRGWQVRCFTLSSQSELLLVRELRGARTGSLVDLATSPKRSVPPKPLRQTVNIENSREFNNHVLRPSNLSPLTSLRFALRLMKAALTPQRFAYFSQTRVNLILRGFRWAANLFRLRRWLKRKGITQIPKSDYVYFALHSQPERTTVPDAGAYWYQPNAIAELRRVLSPEIAIIVGEHPRQIGRQAPDLRQTHYRSVADYENIVGLQNTFMTDWGLRSDNLIAGAVFVASCTGSVGWEALRSGVPTLTFAPTWYSDVVGSLVWDPDGDMVGAIKSLASLPKSSVQRGASDVHRRCFTMGVEGLDFSVEALPASSFGEDEGTWVATKDALAARLAAKLVESYRQRTHVE